MIQIVCEFSVAMLASKGWTNNEVAVHMGRSPGIVKDVVKTYIGSWI